MYLRAKGNGISKNLKLKQLNKSQSVVIQLPKYLIDLVFVLKRYITGAASYLKNLNKLNHQMSN